MREYKQIKGKKMGVSFKVPKNSGDYVDVKNNSSNAKSNVSNKGAVKSDLKNKAVTNSKGNGASLIEKSFVNLSVEHKFYRTTILQNSVKNIEQTFSERRLSWMNVCKIVLTVCFAIPVSMFHWRYQAWGVYFLISLTGLFAWDYISHVRHLIRSKAQVKFYAIKDCPYENDYLSARPDKVDLVAPYLIFVALSLLVISFFEVSIAYGGQYKDSSLIKMIDSASASAGESISKATRGNMKYMNN